MQSSSSQAIKFRIFPVLRPTTSVQIFREVYEGEIFSLNKKAYSAFIPFLIPDEQNSISEKALIYFHGNGYDLHQALMGMLSQISGELKVNTFSNQYFKYEFQAGAPSVNVIQEEALSLYNFVNKKLGFDSKDIIVIGRSIGSGPACYIAANSDCQNLILIHPFYNLKTWVDEKKLPMQQSYEQYQFQNNKNIEKSKARLMIIHGEADEVIKVQHSKRLEQIYSKKLGRQNGVFRYPTNMTHSIFDINQHIINPIKQFLGQPNGDKKQLSSVLNQIQLYKLLNWTSKKQMSLLDEQ